MRRLQNGYVRTYALAMTIGTVVLVVFVLTRVRLLMLAALLAVTAPKSAGFPVLTVLVLHARSSARSSSG